MAADGAAICDVGAESTRPGSDPVPPDEQLARLAGVLDAMRGDRPADRRSRSTPRRPRVAEAALDAGAVLVNDVTAGQGDPGLLPLVAERGAAVCLVHMRGTPRTMQADPSYGDVVAEVRDHLAERLARGRRRGRPERERRSSIRARVRQDAGHNLALLAGVPRLAALGRPVLIGASRKGMFGTLPGRDR